MSYEIDRFVTKRHIPIYDLTFLCWMYSCRKWDKQENSSFQTFIERIKEHSKKWSTVWWHVLKFAISLRSIVKSNEFFEKAFQFNRSSMKKFFWVIPQKLAMNSFSDFNASKGAFFHKTVHVKVVSALHCVKKVKKLYLCANGNRQESQKGPPLKYLTSFSDKRFA